MASPLTLAGGMALGLAASLHCIGMCGGIAAMTLMPAARPVAHARALVAVHAGRVTAYAMLGAMAGGFGTLAVTGLDPELGHRLLRWAAALSLGWIGLSMAGLLPGPTALARLAPACRLGWPGHGGSAFLAGLGWGLLPCGMVYGALIYAMFTGSFLSGALVMAGFGIGTLPGLAGASVCFSTLRSMREDRRSRAVIGSGIALFGLVSLIDTGPAFRAACKAVGL